MTSLKASYTKLPKTHKKDSHSPQVMPLNINKSKKSYSQTRLRPQIIQNSNQVQNQQSDSKPVSKDIKNRTGFSISRHLSWTHGIKLKKNGEDNPLKKQRLQTESRNKQTLQNQAKGGSKLLQKIADHRRIRSSSKISSKIITLTQYFKGDQLPRNQSRQRVKSELFPNDNIENLLQLKLNTQSSIEKIQGDLISFRNTGYSKSSQASKFNFGINIPLKSKKSDLLSKNQLNNSKQLIKQNEQLRKTKNLRPNPKQWQFHNCLMFQKIELYSTNLKISCEGWVVLDHLQLKYLRGWNPKVQDDFSPMIRLFIAKIGLEISQIAKYKLDIDKIFIRVNDKHIYEDQRTKIEEKGEKVKGIAPHTILNLRQLITATILTKHQDLVVHSVLALGYLLKIIHNHSQKQIEIQIDDSDPLKQIKHSNTYNIFITTTESSTLQQYCQYFQKQCKKICQQLFLISTRVVVGFSCLYKDWRRKTKSLLRNPNQLNQFTVISTPLDISILFLKCLSLAQFRQMLSPRIYETQVKHQVGWNFWQTRSVKWPNQEYIKYRLHAVGGRTNKGNECYVVWDQNRDLVISMADCKVNMHWRDTDRIQAWVEKHIARFSKLYCLNMTFFPTDTEKFHKIN